MDKIVKELKQLHPNTPITLFSKNGGKHIEHIASSGCDGIGIDWTVEIGEVQQLVGDKVCIQGNLDPAVLAASDKVIESEVQKVMRQFKGNTGHIFNLGHGITPEIEPEKMTVLVEAVHNFGVKL